MTNVVPCCCLDNNPLFMAPFHAGLAAAIEDPLANLLGYVKCESHGEGRSEGVGLSIRNQTGCNNKISYN